MLRVGTILRGTYRIDSYLSSGGFGNTYVATHIEFEERVAIKEFFMKGVTERGKDQTTVSVSNAENSNSFLEQKKKFKKEACRLRKLKNEHIVSVHDLFDENGTAYYVMDFIDGENLAERLKRTGRPMTESEVRLILPQILDVLNAVHKEGFCHLDIKPSNIMLEKGDKIKLIDFGASKQLGSNGILTTNDPTAFAQTPGFAPRELMEQNFNKIGPCTDIYALGATVYNLLTNKKPPMAIDIEEDGEKAFNFPLYISEEMRKMVVWMMQPKRKARPQNVDELIEKINAGETVKERPIVVSEPEPKPKPEPDSEETLLIGTSDILDKPKQQPKDDEENQTILVVSKKNQERKPHQVPSDVLPQRSIKVGDFIFEDGSYADKIDNDRKPIGVLFSYYGGAHGQILSAVRPNETLSINGKELKWHEASIAEWVEVIQNLGHCKVNFASWEYRFFSNDVRTILTSYQINEVRYATRKSVSGVAYVVNLESCRLTPFEDDKTTLPYIYISEF